MYNVIIKTCKGTHQATLQGITSDSTGYDYGFALADVLEPFMRSKDEAGVEVYDEHGMLCHKLVIVPKTDGMLVTDNGTELLQLNAPFKLNTEKIPGRYLVLVNPELNNNKFYRMIDFGNGTWGAYYGRIGEAQGQSKWSEHVANPHVYKDYMFGIKLKEKIAKGYEDRTECHILKTEERKPMNISVKDDRVAGLLRRLIAFANHTIEQNYCVTTDDVSPKMISEAKKEIRALKRAKTLETFNQHLLELMHIIPRRVDDAVSYYEVASAMAKSPEDFNTIILREENLLSIIEGQVKLQKTAETKECENNDEKDDDVDLLTAMDIEIYVARPEQRAKVEERLSDTLKPKIREVYRVINHKTQKKFDKFLEDNASNGEKPTVKQFWHGSKNENWISILQNGLLLNSDARITGKMFGDGIYFAPSSMKSWGYTSSSSAKWTNEHSDSAFMALYATAYGKPYEAVYGDTNWSHYSYARLRAEHPDCFCVHAKADKCHLMNDEIVFYNQDQITINYLVEFSA